jgi:phosphate-selective porin OprO/OprP
VDNRVFGGESGETADTFILRRVRPTFEGTFGGISTSASRPTSAAASQYRGRLRGSAVQPRVRGHGEASKPPVGLERLQSGADIRFIERGLPTNLVPNRDLGVQFSEISLAARSLIRWATSMA